MPRLAKSSASPQEIILNTLIENQQPLSAYAILEKVGKFGIKSPPIIYRALDALMTSGKVHKINELNSFIACNCADDHQHLLSVLTICQTCDKVSELHDHGVIDHLAKLAEFNIGLIKQAVIELPTICKECALLN